MTLELQIYEPVVCRFPGLPFERFERFAEQPTREKLWALLDDPEFVECLTTMHPTLVGTMRHLRKKFRPDQRPSSLRRAELTLYRYLVRFSTRNDTTGTAGSTLWGHIGAGPAEVRENRPGKRRVVYASPRYLELICWWAARHVLQQHRLVELRPCWRWSAPHLIDPLSGCRIQVRRHESALLDQIQRGPLRWLESTLQQQKCLDSMEKRGWLSYLLGPAQEPRWAQLRRLAPGSWLQEPLEELESLIQILETGTTQEYLAAIEQAAQILRALPMCRSLSFSQTLRELIQNNLEGNVLPLQLCPRYSLQEAGLEDRYTAHLRPLLEAERELLNRLQQSPQLPQPGESRAMLRQFLDQGVVTLEGVSDSRAGNPWDRRFFALSERLERCALAPDSAHQARLLRAAWPWQRLTVNPLAAEFELATLLPANSPAWQRAQDRSFFVCDSTRDVTLNMGPGLQQRLSEVLRPWFRLAAWQEYRREQRAQPWLRRLLEPKRRLPLVQFLDDWEKLCWTEDEPSGQADTLEGSLWSVERDSTGMLAQLTETRCDLDFDRWLADKRCLSTLDMMLSGDWSELEQGSGALLLSEAHTGSEGLGQTTFFPMVHTDKGRRPWHSPCYPDDVLFLQAPLPCKVSDGVLFQLSNVSLGVRNSEGWRPQRNAIPIAELELLWGPQGVALYAGDRPYRLLTDILKIGNIRTVGYTPWHLSNWIGCYTAGSMHIHPEVRLGELVLSRWMISLPAASLAQMLHQGGLRQRLELPRFVFMKGDGKPYFCDLDCPVSLDACALEVARGAQTMIIMPMQPAPQDFWLRLAEGSFSSELRFAATAQGPNYQNRSRHSHHLPLSQ